MTRRSFRWPHIRPSATRSIVALWCKSLLNALLFFGICMVVLPWVSHRMLPVKLPILSAISTCGGGFFLFAGIAMWIYCLDVFIRRGKGTPLSFDTPRYLVTKGLFGVVRNPIMIAELMVIWGEVMCFASLGILVYAIVISIVAHITVVYVEEPELRERFGKSYENYCKRVPRWIPYLKHFR
ncbi:MAG: isoprenylcysteine carboxylmethyltransferase family protein [Candidatus Brocadiaceae bacterium]|nr:isoprenylcysteine carboxylmethyltransferase family protein [Candidatus Brocadiaceae bacterium]